MLRYIYIILIFSSLVACENKEAEDSIYLEKQILELSNKLELGLELDEIQELSIEAQKELQYFLVSNQDLAEYDQALDSKENKNTDNKRVAFSTLELGESKTFTICSEIYWNETWLWLEEGAQYTISAQGEWKDWLITTDANGFTNAYMNLWNNQKRYSNAKWFTLIASINKEEELKIGSYKKIHPESSGLLSFYANDAENATFYTNNSGCLSVTVHRVDTTDTDGDGIYDTYDQCPNTPGTVEGNGCIVMDSDGDGVSNQYDDCPTQYGTCPNGCPMENGLCDPI